MIPITTFAGQEGRGVRPSAGRGFASASALLAGGADVIAWDDTEASVAKAHAAGIPTADLRHIDWSKVAALVLAPGVPLTHPAPHWTVGLARNAAVEVIGDIELFCRERRAHRAGRAVRRHHRHQRQVDDHRADRAPVERRRATTCRWAATSAPRSSPCCRPRPGRVHVVECSSFQIDLAPTLDPIDRHPAQRHRGSPRPPRHASRTTRRSRNGCVDRRRHRRRRRRRQLVRGDRRPHRARTASRVVRISVRRPLPRRTLCGRHRHHACRRAATARPLVQIGGIGSLRGRPQCPERGCRRRRRRCALGLSPESDPERPA